MIVVFVSLLPLTRLYWDLWVHSLWSIWRNVATFVVTSSSSRSSWSSTWTTCWNRGSSTSRSTTSYYGGGTTYESTVDGQPHRITGLSRKSTNLGILSLLWTRTSRTRLCSSMQASPKKLQHYAAPATNVGYYLIQLSSTHGIWPWLSTSRISRNYVVIFSYANSSTSTSATTSIGYLLQPTGTQSRTITVTFTSTSLVYKLPTPAEPILPAPTKTMPPNQHTCDYQPTGSQSSRCTRSTSAFRCTRSTSSSSSSTSSRFSWSSKCPWPSSLSGFSSCPRPTVYPSSSSCSRSLSQCSYPARNNSGTDEWKPTHEPGTTWFWHFGTTPGCHFGEKHRVTEIGSHTYTYTYAYTFGSSTFGNFSIFVLPKTVHSNTNYSSHCHTSQSKTTHTTNGTSSTSCTTQTQPGISFDQGKKFLKKIKIKVQEEKKIQI